VAEEPGAQPEVVSEAEPVVEIVSEPEPAPEPKRRWAALVAEFWKQRTETAVLELRLTDGTTLAPDRFAFARSTADYGIFSIKGDDNLFRVMAIAWDSVACVQLRGMKHVPKDLFEPRADDDRA